ncbi:C-type lectin domain family 12 member A [Sorex fumeus]|uniref:C-type lectin domain family 12 member A n=1 Tax=Sorex fumeus TaxID=62283 RepID=UPI0024AE68BF|nr:C-type lectin domain family 12 member A [Sorex fumeus]
MSEEITYADLNFQDPSKRENTVAFEKLEIEACPPPSRVWHLRVLIFLCLLLMIGLGVLGGMFYVTFEKQMEKVNKLQKGKDELQRNVSLQMMDNMNNTMMIEKLFITLQNMTTKLCRELHRNDKEHECQPCPKRWIWHDDKCYFFNEDTFETWQNSKEICSNMNATLLTIKSRSVLEFIKSRKKLKRSWLGLSFPKCRIPFYSKSLDSINFSERFINSTNDLNDEIYCGSLDTSFLYFVTCNIKYRFICEKIANPVKIESVLMNEVPDRRRYSPMDSRRRTARRPCQASSPTGPPQQSIGPSHPGFSLPQFDVNHKNHSFRCKLSSSSSPVVDETIRNTNLREEAVGYGSIWFGGKRDFSTSVI